MIEVVAVTRTRKELERARTIRDNSAHAPSPSESDQAARREFGRIEQAIRDKDDRVLNEYGNLHACLKRVVGLKDLPRRSGPAAMIDGFTTWRLRRLSGGGPRTRIGEGRCRSASAHQPMGCMCIEAPSPCGRPRFLM